MKLILLSGLPGTGKSTIAHWLGSEYKIPVFSKDWVEGALKQIGHQEIEGIGLGGYALMTSLARAQLTLGQSVILDSVASLEEFRDKCKALAREFNAEFYVIECTCSDEELHKKRIAKRERNIPGWHELTWEDVTHVQNYFEPWEEDHLIVDTAVLEEEQVKKQVKVFLKL